MPLLGNLILPLANVCPEQVRSCQGRRGCSQQKQKEPFVHHEEWQGFFKLKFVQVVQGWRIRSIASVGGLCQTGIWMLVGDENCAWDRKWPVLPTGIAQHKPNRASNIPECYNGEWGEAPKNAWKRTCMLLWAHVWLLSCLCEYKIGNDKNDPGLQLSVTRNDYVVVANVLRHVLLGTWSHTYCSM